MARSANKIFVESTVYGNGQLVIGSEIWTSTPLEKHPFLGLHFTRKGHQASNLSPTSEAYRRLQVRLGSLACAEWLRETASRRDFMRFFGLSSPLRMKRTLERSDYGNYPDVIDYLLVK